MYAVKVRELKSNPSEALREAKQGPVVVMNRDRPDAVLIGIGQVGITDLPRVRQAMAVALFRGGHISAMAARVAGLPLAEMLALLSAMQIPLYGRLACRGDGRNRRRRGPHRGPWRSPLRCRGLLRACSPRNDAVPWTRRPMCSSPLVIAYGDRGAAPALGDR